MVVATIKTMNGAGQGRLIIFGAAGMLGHALGRSFSLARFIGREVDITDGEAVWHEVTTYQPSLVINAAAYTDVDGCEENRDWAFRVNGEGPGYIAEACNELGASLLHFSSDYVFDGMKNGYDETDEPHPVNVYGASKLQGEKNIQNLITDFRIIRTSWLFGPQGKNFVDTVRRLSREMEHVPVVNDQTGRPTYTRDLAEKTREVLHLPPGIYHITNEGTCSWYEFARAFIPNAIPCSSDEMKRRAKRPRNSVLLNTKTAPMRHWKDALAEYLNEKGEYPV